MPEKFITAARVLLFAPFLWLVACTPAPHLDVTPAQYQDLTGWPTDPLDNVKTALGNSCAALDKKRSYPGGDARFGRIQDWQRICAALPQVADDQLPAFIAANFAPYALSNNGAPDGLFTGYYQAQLNGSLLPDAQFHIPLYARPDDLGIKTPYDTRADIMAYGLAGRARVLVYVDDAVAAFFLSVQGSGLVRLTDGTFLPLGYDGQNGQPYTAIGRELIKRGELAKETVSMQTIAAWLYAHPDQANEIMNSNPSYVFFKVMPDTGAVGGQGVVLTPLRSLAVDRKFIPYGSLLWLVTDQPPLARLVVAQDTGGAITGPVRGDVFWGTGPDATAQAGVMKASGRYWALVPRPQ